MRVVHPPGNQNAFDLRADPSCHSLHAGRQTTVELAGLFIYPVKSLRGVCLDAAAIVNGRLVGDREWVLVDSGGRFMHQRDHPQMARVEAWPTSVGIAVRAPALPELEVERPAFAALAPDAVRPLALWRRASPVVHIGAHVDGWFTRALGVRCQLMAFVPGAPGWHVPWYEANSSLQDATAFHMTAEESLADLNRRMNLPIPMNRFRPSLVVRGAEPYAEDRWRTIAIGDTVLRWVKHCTRCVTTTTDQETGERMGREPLLTLASYRHLGNEVVFGNYYFADRWGASLRVGDRVTVVQ